MDVDKFNSLNLTREEINRFSEVMEDEQFRKLFSEFVEEISDPENKKKYEEEIRQLEEERGMNVQFIHPEGHHVLKTGHGKDQYFINVCSDELIDKPSCRAARSGDGKPGLNWSLPFSVTPARRDGDTHVTHDVVFHPDTLQMARKNDRFMNLVNSTAIQAIQDTFKVKLDNSHTELLNMKYKGVPHPAVIRRPVSEKKPCSSEELLSFQYPDETNRAEDPSESSTAAIHLTQPHSEHTRASLSKQPIKPHYIMKYRSVVDLQDYRCSRDSAPSSRPKDIIIIIDLPLIKSANDLDLSVTERNLVLESQKPSYKLDLQLTYSVDYDKGDAKFNKAKKHLTITLPVKDPELTQIRHDDEERKVESVEGNDEPGQKIHGENEKLCKTDHKRSNCDILTQSTRERGEQEKCEVDSFSSTVNVMDCSDKTSDHQSVHLMNDTHTPETSNQMLNRTEEPKKNQHLSNTCVPEMNFDHQDYDINSHLEEISKTVPLIEETLKDPAAVVNHYRRDQRETNPDDRHKTSAALRFQNSLWFDLD